MSALTQLWNEFWAIFREGLPHINVIEGLVIALIGGLMAQSFFGLFVIALFAVIVNIVADALVPVVLHGAHFALPTIDHVFWHYALTLYVVYLVVIGAIFLVKSLFGAVRS